MHILAEKMSLDCKMHAWKRLNIGVAEDCKVHTDQSLAPGALGVI